MTYQGSIILLFTPLPPLRGGGKNSAQGREFKKKEKIEEKKREEEKEKRKKGRKKGEKRKEKGKRKAKKGEREEKTILKGETIILLY